jgi:hypothetical protein
MIFFQYDSNKPMPLKTKLGLIFGIVVGLAVLAVFAFTFFIVALAGGLFLFIFNFFRPKKDQVFDIRNQYESRSYKKPSNNDVIDI